MTKLKAMLQKRKTRQTDLARLSKTGKDNVCHHVKDGIKTTRVAKRYAAVLECSPLELLEV